MRMTCEPPQLPIGTPLPSDPAEARELIASELQLAEQHDRLMAWLAECERERTEFCFEV